jgi:hypothetical protein
MAKILISIISYKEGDLLGTVLDCYNKAKNKEDLVFSIVEEHYPEFYSDLSFVPEDQMLYRKFDLSEYRGILWARDLTTKDLPFDYDYVLYMCGHTRFEQNWDDTCTKEYKNIQEKSGVKKSILSFQSPMFEINEDGTLEFEKSIGPKVNTYYPRLDVTKDFGYEFAPGYWFPDVREVPQDTEFIQSYWIHFTWCFASKDFVDEVPFDISIGWTAEEIYCSVQAWSKGWKIFAIPNKMYYHHTIRKYPGEKEARNDTHRPWADKNKDKYWENVDYSILRLNRMLSGKLEADDKFFIDNKIILDYCRESGLNTKYTEYDENYHNLDNYQQRKHLRNALPVKDI